MGNKVNYNNMYKAKTEEPKMTLGEIKEELTDAAPAEEPVIEEAKAEELEVVEERVAEEVKTPVKEEKPKTKIGKVTGGLNLNVRKAPNGDVIQVLSNGTQVTIKKDVDADWYEISEPVSGFVMKKFISI